MDRLPRARLPFSVRMLLALPILAALLLVTPLPIFKTFRSVPIINVFKDVSTFNNFLYDCATLRIFCTFIGDGAPITILLEFVVLDGGSGLPIEGASIQIPQPIWSKAGFTATTDSDGRARIQFDTVFSERASYFSRVQRHVTYHAEVNVASEGYRTKRFALSDLTLKPAYHYDTAPPPIIIRMEKLHHESGR